MLRRKDQALCLPPNKRMQRTRDPDKGVLCLGQRRVADARRYTAQMALCVAKLSVLCLLVGVATSCSPVFIVELFNNTGGPVVIMLRGGDDQETIGVAAGRSVKIRETSLQGGTVSFQGAERNFEFDVSRFLLPAFGLGVLAAYRMYL